MVLMRVQAVAGLIEQKQKQRAASEAAAAAAVMQTNEQKVNQFHSPHHGQQAYGRKSRETNTAALEKQPGVDL